MKPYFTALLFAALLNAPANAQDEPPFSSERPSFSSSPFALATGFWQFEGGYAYTKGPGSGASSHTVPNGLLRWGFAPRFEVQLNWVGYRRDRISGASVSGATDAELGVKWQITPDDAGFAVGLYGGVSLPVGDDAFTSDDNDPKLGVFFSHTNGLFGAATHSWSDGGNTLATGLGWSFTPFGEVGSFVEWQATVPEHGSSSHALATALTWMVGSSLQLDVNASVGLDDDAADYVLGAGLATRW